MRYLLAVLVAMAAGVGGVVLVARGTYDTTRLALCTVDQVTAGARVCPGGDGVGVFLIVAGVVLSIAATVIFALRPGGPRPPAPRQQLAGASWVVLFGALAFGIWLAGHGEAAVGDPGVGHTVAVVTFAVLAAVPLVVTIWSLITGNFGARSRRTVAIPGGEAAMTTLHERLRQMEEGMGGGDEFGDRRP